MRQLPKSVGAGNPHATFCGNRGRVTASGDPVGGETGLAQGPATAPFLDSTRGDRGRRRPQPPLTGPDVVVAVIIPLAAERVIEIAVRQRFVLRQHVDGCEQQGVEALAVRSRSLPLAVLRCNHIVPLE